MSAQVWVGRFRREDNAEHRHQYGRDLLTDQWQTRKITLFSSPLSRRAHRRHKIGGTRICKLFLRSK